MIQVIQVKCLCIYIYCRLPKHKEKASQWKINIGLAELIDKEIKGQICENHFARSDLNFNPKGRITLKNNAMPLVASTASIPRRPPSQPDPPDHQSDCVKCNCKIEYIKEKRQYQTTIEKYTKINNNLRKQLKKYQNHANFLKKTKKTLEQTIREFTKQNDGNDYAKVNGENDEVSRLMKVGLTNIKKIDY